uniref:Uncharacterized protein n=1 Tax=Sus scrofa TaxID=9823 RepID=A0A8D1V556_PIG
MRLQVRSLALLSGLRTRPCRELWCRSQTRLGSGIAVALCRPSATALLRPLAWEPPYAMGAALKRQKAKKKKGGGAFQEPAYVIGGNVNLCCLYGKQYGSSSKKLKIELPYNPAIPLRGIYPEKTIIRKDTCTPMFTAALFTAAKTWKQPKCPSTEEWIKKMWYIYTMEYYSVVKKKKK